jgi:hypothetical protein
MHESSLFISKPFLFITFISLFWLEREEKEEDSMLLFPSFNNFYKSLRKHFILLKSFSFLFIFLLRLLSFGNAFKIWSIISLFTGQLVKISKAGYYLMNRRNPRLINPISEGNLLKHGRGFSSIDLYFLGKVSYKGKGIYYEKNIETPCTFESYIFLIGVYNHHSSYLFHY